MNLQEFLCRLLDLVEMLADETSFQSPKTKEEVENTIKTLSDLVWKVR